MPEPRLPGPDVADLMARMDVRRRARWRTLAVSATPVVAVALVVSFGHPSGDAGLDVADRPRPTRTPTYSPAPTATPTTGATPGPGHPSGTPGQLAAVEVPGPVPPASGEMPSPYGSPGYFDGRRTPDARQQLPDEPVTYSFHQRSDDAKVCDDYVALGPDQFGPPAWCTAYPGALTYRSGVETVLPVELCHDRYAPAAEARPGADGRWLDVAVYRLDGSGNPDSSAPRWSWNSPAPPAGAVTFEPSDCARWTISWAAVDDFGTPLDPGDYRIYPRFDLDGEDRVLAMPVDVTVTE